MLFVLDSVNGCAYVATSARHPADSLGFKMPCVSISSQPKSTRSGIPVAGVSAFEANMAKLTAAKRKRMPKSEFAGPGRSFPVNDPTHARLAISGATRAQRAGNISASTAASIKAKARRKLKDIK